LDATVFVRLSFGPWPRTRTTRPFFKFSCSNGSTAPGTWRDFTSCRSNRRSSRIWRLCDGGVGSGARDASGSTCTRPGRSRKSSSRNGSIARGAADTSSARERRSQRDAVADLREPRDERREAPVGRNSTARKRTAALLGRKLFGGAAHSNRHGIRRPFGSSRERRLKVRQFHVRRRGQRKMIGSSSGERRVVNDEIADKAAWPAEDAIQREYRSPRWETQH